MAWLGRPAEPRVGALCHSQVRPPQRCPVRACALASCASAFLCVNPPAVDPRRARVRPLAMPTVGVAPFKRLGACNHMHLPPFRAQAGAAHPALPPPQRHRSDHGLGARQAHRPGNGQGYRLNADGLLFNRNLAHCLCKAWLEVLPAQQIQYRLPVTAALRLRIPPLPAAPSRALAAQEGSRGGRFVMFVDAFDNSLFPAHPLHPLPLVLPHACLSVRGAAVDEHRACV